MIETGMFFDNIHSFYDLNLILSAVDIPPAIPKTSYVDIPGGDGSIDLTEAHGEVKFDNRKCKFTFSMLPTDDLTWEEKQTQVSNALNGKLCKITLDKDPDYYYLGRCTIDSYKQDKKLRQFVVSAEVKPYKFKQKPTIFSCELTAEEQTFNLENGRKSVVPIIECSDDNTMLSFGGATYSLSAGKYKLLDICFVEGDNVLTLSGSGTITITYQEGML